MSPAVGISAAAVHASSITPSMRSAIDAYGIPFLLVALGFGWATKAIGFLRRHIRVVNILGGVLLILLGVLMVTGLWTDIMSRLTAVIGSVILPL